MEVNNGNLVSEVIVISVRRKGIEDLNVLTPMPIGARHDGNGSGGRNQQKSLQ